MPQEKQIKTMFNNISSSYDLLNDLLSLGIHRLWKRKLVKNLSTPAPKSFLDCATGTGDIALMLQKKSPDTQIIGIDFSINMLAEAKKKTDTIIWEEADVMKLKYQDNQFEVSSISYGIRNVEDYHQALKEMGRVTSSKLCVLEFGQPQFAPFRFIYFAIMNYLMPLMGKLFNKQEAYKYLVDSSKSFPCGEDFVSVIKKATEFKNIKCYPLFGGVTYLYIASDK